jgi:hypothetical protein
MTNTRYEVQEHEAGGWVVFDTETGKFAEVPTESDADQVAAFLNKLDSEGVIRRTEVK